MLAVLFARLGPYHVARLRAAADQLDLTAIEVASDDGVYAWDPVAGNLPFRRTTLFPGGRPGRRREVVARVHAALDACGPRIVAIPGWSDPAASAALAWCLGHGRPAVLLSESTARDRCRHVWKEGVKARLVRCFAAALVGGSRHRDYVCRLGMAADRVFLGYDAVDNDYFAAGADAARGRAGARRAELGLPDRYFLACQRFVPLKNTAGLLGAFRRYRDRAGPGSWKLVLAGDGPLRSEIRSACARAGIDGSVLLPGFVQYPRLPAYYGLASAFVLPSTTEPWGLVVNEAMAAGLPVLVSSACGSADDLVEPGRNGFRFDPRNEAELADLLGRIAAGGSDLEAMGRAGRALVDRWSPERFAEGLVAAVEAAGRRPCPVREPRMARALLRLLVPEPRYAGAQKGPGS